MKTSDFWRLMDDEFGEQYAHVLAKTLYVPDCGGMTVQQALDAGGDTRQLWLEICRVQQVPEERWLGKDMGIPEKAAQS